MITIGSYVHRSLLCDIIRRWMFGDLRPTDGDQVTRLVHFNNIYVSRYLDIFSRWVLEALHGAGVESRTVALKGELKDALVENPAYRNARVDELIRDYRGSPGRYYRETPFYGTLYFRDPGEGPHCLGASRIKRIRRLAEKAARRIIDQIFMNIREHAEALAEERARFLGVSRSHLVSSREEMIAEFLRAEERFLDDLRNRRALSGMGPLVINDVAGLKIILERESQERLKEILLSRDACDIVEEETHKGKYNATNYIVRFVPPREEIVSVPLGDRILRILSHRGWSGEAAAEEFREFILTGERSVYLEIIVSTYQETLESEIGRSIHEDRIVAQRLSRPYRGHLAVNVEYLMEYLFFFPFSQQAEIKELPIRLWYRYLPDYFDEVVKEMFQIPLTGALD